MGYYSQPRWSDEEYKVFWHIIEKHGRNYRLLNENLPNKNREQIYQKVRAMKKELLQNANSNLRERLQGRLESTWTQRELEIMLLYLSDY